MNQSKQRGRADNTIRAGGMTTEPVRGGSSRGRDRQEDRELEVNLRSPTSLAAR